MNGVSGGVQTIPKRIYYHYMQMYCTCHLVRFTITIVPQQTLTKFNNLIVIVTVLYSLNSFQHNYDLQRTTWPGLGFLTKLHESIESGTVCSFTNYQSFGVQQC